MNPTSISHKTYGHTSCNVFSLSFQDNLHFRSSRLIYPESVMSSVRFPYTHVTHCSLHCISHIFHALYFNVGFKITFNSVIAAYFFVKTKKPMSA